MSSRYTPSYSSRYGSGRDYGLGSTSSYSSRDRDSLSSSSYGRDRDSSRYTSSYSSSRPKYSSYASKYSSSDYGKSVDNMEDFNAAPIAKDEIEELSYDSKTPTEEIAPQEVLHESQISDFVEEEPEKTTEVEEVKLTLAPEVDQEDDEEEEEEEEDEVRKAQELLASSTQIREASPVASPVSSPIKVVAETFSATNDNTNEAENRTPSPTVANAKKLGGIPWPPKASDVEKKGGDTEELPKKRVSDLIARFNTGIVDEGKKSDGSYKAEYGAGTNVGKVQTHNFA